MDKSFALLLSDLVETLNAINVEDLTMPLGFLLWTIILFLPLWRIDRRDLSSASTYVLFCMAVGVALVFALPQSFTQPPPIKTQAIATLGMAAIAAIRWNIRFDRMLKKEIRTQKSFAKEDEEFGRRNANDPAANAGRPLKAAS